MRQILIAISLVYMLPNNLNAQNNYEVNPTFELWQRLTVSLGNIKQKLYNKRKYKYYNILGSGIVAYVIFEKKSLPVIITAKHVLQNKDHTYLDSVRVRFSWASDSSVYEYFGSNLILRQDKETYFFELADTTIDLVCIPLYDLTDSVYKPELARILPYSIFASDWDYFEGRDIYTLGYPASIGSKYWTRGLLRKGIISWLPNSGIESTKFIIDCNVYPGNSGGPVFSFPRAGDIAIGRDTSIFENKFFGIVVERRLNYNDVFQLDTTGTKKNDNVQMLSGESMGVGIVEPAKNVLKLLKYTQDYLDSHPRKDK